MLRLRMVAIDDDVDGDDDDEEEDEEATLFTELCVRMWCWWWEPWNNIGMNKIASDFQLLS